MREIVITLITFFLSTIKVSPIQIPCEFVSSNWNQNNRYALSSRQTIVQTKYDFSMIIDSIDGTVSRSIKDQGIWQSSIVHLAAYFIKPEFKILNLGSQTGLQAIVLGKLIGPKGKLYIFEPYSVSYNIVKKNIYLNDLEDISEIYCVGASDIQTKSKMLIFPENTGGAEIFLANIPALNPERNIIQEDVEVDLVDQILPQDVMIDFVLMDVEKMEVEALIGMKKLIQRSKNIIILLQWQYSANSNRNQAKTLRLLEWIESKQLKIYKYEENQQNKCSIGSFKQIKIYQLLSLPVLDILIVPSHINPNNYDQS